MFITIINWGGGGVLFCFGFFVVFFLKILIHNAVTDTLQ